MPIIQSIASALEKNIGPHGVADAALAAMLDKAQGALDALRARHADGSLPLLRLPERQDDLAAIGEAARRLSEGASDIVVLGTGGSSLGGQTLAQLAWLQCAGRRRVGRRRRACISSTISIRSRSRPCWRSCRSPPRASSRSRNPAAPPRR